MSTGEKPPIHTIRDRDFQFAMDTRPARELGWQDFTRRRAFVLQERRRVIQDSPSVTSLYREGAEPMIQEARSFFGLTPGSGGEDDLIDLGTQFEHDIVLLRKGQEDNEPTMEAGLVCFPSAWRPEEKLGLPISSIHAPVPTLNSSIGVNISRFLNKLRPDQPYERWGWGMSATDLLNLHPDQEFPRIQSAMGIDDLFIRWEHQGFQSLPDSQGVMFLIQIHVQPLRDLVSNPDQRLALRRQLETMDSDVVAYKGISPVRDRLLLEL